MRALGFVDHAGGDCHQAVGGEGDGDALAAEGVERVEHWRGFVTAAVAGDTVGLVDVLSGGDVGGYDGGWRGRREVWCCS